MDLKMDTQKLKKQVQLFLVFGGVLLLGYCILLFQTIGSSKTYTQDETMLSKVDVVFSVDNISQYRGYITIQGWSIIEGENIERNTTRILLFNEEKDEFLMIPTMMERRNDIFEKFNNFESEIPFNYERSGWIARVSLRRLSNNLESYQVVILHQTNDHYVLAKTEKYLGE